MRNRILYSLMAGVVSLTIGIIAGEATAGGFMLFEQGVKGLGNAFAGGSAGAEDASTIFYNPAGMTRLNGTHMVLGADYIIPQAEFNDEGSTLSPVLTGGAAVPLRGNDGGDGGVAKPVPHFYVTHEISPSFYAGLGLTVPFGLATDYDQGWVGRYHALKSELITIDINPSLAYKVNSWVSIGGGVSAQYIDAQLTNAIDYGAIGAALGAPTLPQSLDGQVNIKADDWGFRWNVGVLVEPSKTLRFGLAYRSKIDYSLSGTADFDIPTAAVPIAVGAGLVDNGAGADITLPAHASLSGYWQFNPKWAVMADIFWTQWDSLDVLQIELDNGRLLDTTLEWENALRYALGLTYFADPSWIFRVGAAWEETPIPDAQRRTPRIPDNDRFWATIGLTYQISETIGLDAAYAHLFVDDPEVDKSGIVTEDIFKGKLSGTFDATVDIISLQLTAVF